MTSWSLAECQEQHANTRLIPCPGCQHEGFFGATWDGAERWYWLCKFCGYYREPDTAPVQLRPTTHGCPQHGLVLGALYIQWVQAHEDPFTCHFCEEKVAVEDALVPRPVDEPSHPWWQFPQGLQKREAMIFWAAHGQPGMLIL